MIHSPLRFLSAACAFVHQKMWNEACLAFINIMNEEEQSKQLASPKGCLSSHKLKPQNQMFRQICAFSHCLDGQWDHLFHIIDWLAVKTSHSKQRKKGCIQQAQRQK